MFKLAGQRVLAALGRHRREANVSFLHCLEEVDEEKWVAITKLSVLGTTSPLVFSCQGDVMMCWGVDITFLLAIRSFPPLEAGSLSCLTWNSR